MPSLEIVHWPHGGWGYGRIGGNESRAPYNFKQWRRKAQEAGDSKKLHGAMVAVARKYGADPDQWRVGYTPVERHDWKLIEVLEGGKWVTATPSKIAEQAAAVLEWKLRLARRATA